MKTLPPNQFIGHTGANARSLFARLATLPPDADPMLRRWLFTGDPGTGKSTLAWSLALHAAGNPLAVELINGQDCTVEKVRQWMAARCYRSLFGPWTVLIVDEIDQAKADAVGQLRTYLDWLHPGILFLATTNRDVSALPAPLQSRFIRYQFPAVETPTIAAWLMHRFCLAASLAEQIAKGANGDVRAAQTDALAMTA